MQSDFLLWRRKNRAKVMNSEFNIEAKLAWRITSQLTNYPR